MKVKNKVVPHKNNKCEERKRVQIFFDRELEKVPPSKHKLALLLKKSSIILEDSQLAALWKFHNLLRKYNEECDLTRLYSFDSMVVKHYIDCMIIKNQIQLPSQLLDIGAGAGFPSIPLKILCPSVSIIAAEGRPKRVWFMELVKKELNLKNFEVYGHKLVELSEIRSKGIITRAFETMDKTLKRVQEIVLENGVVIFMKGPDPQEEIDLVRDRKISNFTLEKKILYTLPFTTQKRSLVLFKKTGKQ